MRKHSKYIAGLSTFLCIMFTATPLFAQVTPQSSTTILLIATLSLVPFLLILVTSFVKIAVVLSLLRTAIGVGQVPSNQIITGLAILLSIYIMAPVGMESYAIVEPLLVRMEQAQPNDAPKFSEYKTTTVKAAQPLKRFLIKHAQPRERQLLYELALELRTPEQQKTLGKEDLIVIAPAFILTELKEAFTIGFLLFIPFLIIDLVVATTLLSLGMHMLNPTSVSMPFKLLLFVLVDGWFLIFKGLILGYAHA